MAIAEHAIGVSWITATTDQVAGFIGGGVLTGERIFLYATWKDFSVTAQITSPATWTLIGSFADGSVASGNGTGSMKIACWYHDWLGDGSETDPTIDFSGAIIGGVGAMIFSKGSTEAWEAPQAVFGSIPSSSASFNITANNPLDVIPGDLVMGICGIRDDSTTITRSATTAIGMTGITWDGNYHESPSTHLSTTTGNDMSADSGYRIAASGSANVAPTMTGTLAAAETGAAMWIKQRAAVPKTYLDIPVGMAVGRDY